MCRYIQDSLFGSLIIISCSSISRRRLREAVLEEPDDADDTDSEGSREEIWSKGSVGGCCLSIIGLSKSVIAVAGRILIANS
jgi:hypothetical protein